MHLPTTMHPTPQPQPQQPQQQTTGQHHPHPNTQQQQQQHYQHPQQPHHLPNPSPHPHSNAHTHAHQHHDGPHPQQQHHNMPHHAPHIAHPNSGHHIGQHQQPFMHAQQRQQQQFLQQTHNDHTNQHHHVNQQLHLPQHAQHHHQSQAQPHQLRQPLNNHHMNHSSQSGHQNHPMMMNHSQYPPMMYAPINIQFVPPTGGHFPAHFNNLPNMNYRTDNLSVNSQLSQPSAQAHPAPPPHPPQQQQQQQQTTSINHNNIPQRIAPIPAPVVSTSSTNNTGVQHINNGPSLDPHLQNRIPMNPPYMIPGSYMNPYNHMQMTPYAMPPGAYPGTNMAHNNPAMMPPRLPADLGIRPAPIDAHNQLPPIPRAAPLNPAAIVMASKPAVPIPTSSVVPPVPNSAPQVPDRPRVRKALAIVDPRTRHVFTEDELKGSVTDTKTTSAASNTTSVPSSTSKPTTPTTGNASVASPTDPEEKKTSKTEIEPSTDDTTRDIKKMTTSTTAIDPITSTTQNSIPLPNNMRQNVLESLPVTISNTSPISGMSTISTNSTASTKSEAITANLVAEVQILSIADPKRVASPTLKPMKEDTETTAEDPTCDTNNHRTDVSHDISSTGDIVKKDQGESVDDQEKVSGKKINSNLPYAPDQFSPINRDGRRKYTINFLMAIGRAMGHDFTPVDHDRDPFRPNFINEHNHFNNYRDASMGRRANQQSINKPPRKIIAIPTLPEIELKTAEKPWKPELETEKNKTDDTGEVDTKRLLKTFRGLLNKLTPQKYDSIIEKVELLDLEYQERLISVIDLVFDKAVDEPGFCNLYASLCKVIAEKNTNFSFHLIKKCQGEFETTDLYDGLDVEKRTVAIESEGDVAKKKILEEELYEDMRLRRKKYLGTIKLIGEMYKLGLLIPKIIGFCIKHLMQEANNENLECLCSLITTVGATMASETDPNIQNSLKACLDILGQFAHNKKSQQGAFVLESRIRFKILDIIELSRRNWRPRMVENNPKKIEEIREEAKQEELIQRHHHNHTKNTQKNDDRDRFRRPGNMPSSFTKSGAYK